ncbi:hypothetical protein PHYSODRAFT_433195, partial [Phytophthora sojae]
RYLGAHVGSRVSTDFTWHTTVTQLKTRLRLASIKLLTEDQCAIVAAAVVIPKITSIARHAWPTTRQVQELQRRI